MAPADDTADQGIPQAALEDVGLASDLGPKIDAGIYAGLLPGLHAVLVARTGKLVLERYYQWNDESWGRQLGLVPFAADTLHDLRSVTKSVVSLLYGIALDRGLVPPPDAPLFSQFPEYDDLAADPRRAQLTVRHALTMTLGMEWDEQRPYTDPANSEIAMEKAPDRYRFILERPLVADPGSQWIYSGGAVALLGALIARGSGMSLPEFAREALFTPLGISDFEWAAGNDGVPSAASGLRLRGRDLLRIGLMALAGGREGTKSVVSQDWLKASFSPAVRTSDGLDYGYLWFQGATPVPNMPGPGRWIAGFGNGGQRLYLMPEAEIAVVIFAGRYNMVDAWITPGRIWREIVLPNVIRG